MNDLEGSSIDSEQADAPLLPIGVGGLQVHDVGLGTTQVGLCDAQVEMGLEGRFVLGVEEGQEQVPPGLSGSRLS